VGRYVWRVGRWYVFVSWSCYLGYYPTSIVSADPGGTVGSVTYPDVRRRAVKKPIASAPPTKPEDVPPVVSVVLKKFPRLLAFLVDRWYDDGSPRLPGSVWFDSDIGAAKALLKEPSLCLCARVRAATVDDLYAACETFLGLESPPWEPDVYAMEQQAKKKKK
jgi:hypothetical protein